MIEILIRSTEKFVLFDKEIIFIRVNPENLNQTIKDILLSLANLSWLSKISSKPVRSSFEHNATRTVDELERRFESITDESEMKSKAGEYIVSVLSKKAIVQVESHNDIPLMELVGRKVVGNPGFDFYTEKIGEVCLLFCGEAKYENQKNSYNSSLSQIGVFLSERKHISDLHLLEKFVCENSMNNLSEGTFGITSAFSTRIDSDNHTLIERIKGNEHFSSLIQNAKSIILVGVDI